MRHLALVLGILASAASCGGTRPSRSAKEAAQSTFLASVGTSRPVTVPEAPAVALRPPASGELGCLFGVPVDTTKILQEIGEPSLEEVREKGGLAIRFVWLRSWDPSLVIRLTPSADGATVEGTELQSASVLSTSAPQPTHRAAGSISPQQLQLLLDALKGISFWTLKPPTHQGYDGAWWILEVAQNGQRRCVMRWGGEELSEIGLALARLSNVPVRGDLY